MEIYEYVCMHRKSFHFKIIQSHKSKENRNVSRNCYRKLDSIRECCNSEVIGCT